MTLPAGVPAAVIERPFGAAGWRRAALAALAGAIATLGLAPYHIVPAAFIAFPMLVLAIDGLARRGEGLAAAFRLGWWFGFGYFIGGLWWLGAAMLVDAAAFWWALPLAVLGLPAVLAVYFGLAVATARRFWSSGAERILVLALAFTLAEFLRARLLTGFPWNEIGMMAAPWPLFMQSAAIWGTHGLTLVGVVVLSLPVLALRRQAGRPTVAAIGLSLLAFHSVYGACRLAAELPAPEPEPAHVRIVQPAIDQSRKWDPAEANAILRLLMDMTAPRADSPPDEIVVWPESSFPYLISDRSPVVDAVAQSLGPGARLLAGAARMEERAGAEPRYYNSILAIRPDGTVDGRFDKLHLVPFGEYLPFQSLLEQLGIMQLTQLPGGFSAAQERRSGKVDGVPPFLPLICYEVIFPGEIRRQPGDAFVLNVTNDAWYGDTPGPYQHLAHARLTALALALPLVRAANSGISVVTDSVGRDVARMDLGERGTIAAPLPAPGPETMVSKHGNLVVWLLSAAALLTVVALRRSHS